jgi:hypothetical protein
MKNKLEYTLLLSHKTKLEYEIVARVSDELASFKLTDYYEATRKDARIQIWKNWKSRKRECVYVGS